MSRDTLDMFQDKERGRFGDNEQAPRLHDRNEAIAVTLTLRNDRKPLALAVSKGDSREWIWLAKSQVQYRTVGKGNVEVTLPRWMAEEKGLV